MAAEALQDAESAVPAALGQEAADRGVVAGGVHHHRALRPIDDDVLQRGQQLVGLQRAGRPGGLGEGMHAQVGPLAEVGQQAIALRPQAVDAGPARQRRQQPPVARGVHRHEIGVAAVQAFPRVFRQQAGHQVVEVAHHRRHLPLQAAFGEALQHRDLVGAGEIGHEDVGARLPHLVQHGVDLAGIRVERQVNLAHRLAADADQRPLGGIDGAARPFVVVAGEEHLLPQPRGGPGDHLVYLLIGQRGKMEEIARGDAAGVESEIEIGHPALAGHLVRHRDAGVGQQVAYQRRAAGKVHQAQCRRHRAGREAAVVRRHQLQRQPQHAALGVHLVAGDGRGADDFLAVHAHQAAQRRQQSQPDGIPGRLPRAVIHAHPRRSSCGVRRGPLPAFVLSSKFSPSRDFSLVETSPPPRCARSRVSPARARELINNQRFEMHRKISAIPRHARQAG
ncbi:hypothetical protein CV_0840 [Chromobacterium violaceum ATCC 12472]|uniref:Uncharacterized protein n=1 Tax=Chromobacterium violaceum (strain ATCC 12472 / DSM 30191 / JCM 1249 / CCUG 213 / NBRC 12614 / NCIMB 9131 / NCTC 9757 / MK) TaxID=243365 RepID=Q7NZT1_CHRVO|nr:hypothetical protein CV_0840 [Chromobacterium violaceum ATCC 12472]